MTQQKPKKMGIILLWILRRPNEEKAELASFGEVSLVAHPHQLTQQDSLTMDAIRKKMQSLKSETDGLYKTISGFEEATREAAARADQVRLYTSICSEEFSYSGH